MILRLLDKCIPYRNFHKSAFFPDEAEGKEEKQPVSNYGYFTPQANEQADDSVSLSVFL